MDSGLLAVLLLGVGLAVLVLEIFVPSGGLLAVVTLMCLAGSGVFAWEEWWGTDPTAFWLYVGCVTLLVPGTVVGAFLMLPRTKFGRRLLQEAPTKEEITPMAEESAQLDALVGERGVTLTTHSPGGLVEVAGQRHHAEARGLMLDPGQPIEVVGVRGQRLLVRLADAPAPPPDDPAAPEPEEATEDPAPAPPVIAADPARPGGRVSENAPVGYSPPVEKDEEKTDDGGGIDFEIPEDDAARP